MNISLWSLDKRHIFETRMAVYTDGLGNESVMKWIPPFRAARALTAQAAEATPSNTIADWINPLDIDPGWTEGTDYQMYDMGGFWADMYLCSAPDATSSSIGGSTLPYISQPLVVPMVLQNISHFKTRLAQRFENGNFKGDTESTEFSGKGGLMTDAHWNEIWVWTRINRLLLMGNTDGANSPGNVPVYHGDPGQIGVVDPTQAENGGSLTGGGPSTWDIVLSDFCGNRWEFTDGLRLDGGQIFSAGKAIDPPSDHTSAPYVDTGLSIAGVSNAQSVSSYRPEPELAAHSIAASTVSAGSGRFDGQGFWFNDSGVRVARRGGNSARGARCPGAVRLSDAASGSHWDIGARAVLVP